jgi:multiple sugar transport system permease protein
VTGISASARETEAAAPRKGPAAPPAWADHRRMRRLARWAFLLPAAAYVLFAFAVPVVYNLLLSFEQTSPATISHLTAPFAGLSNYTTTLRDPTADSAIARTFSFTVLSLLFQFLIGFSLAHRAGHRRYQDAEEPPSGTMTVCWPPPWSVTTVTGAGSTTWPSTRRSEAAGWAGR